MEFFRVTNEQQARDLIRIMPDVVSIDTEYVKGNPRTTQLLSVIVADGERAWAFPPSLLPILSQTIRTRRCVFLQDYNHCDTTILLKYGCDLRETYCLNVIDIHHLVDENADHDLGSRVLEEFKDDYKSQFWSKYKNFEDAPDDDALDYMCRDGIYTYRLAISDLGKLTDKQKELLEHVRKLSLALFETELNGLCVNESLIRDTQSIMEVQINETLPKLREQFLPYCEIWEYKKWAEEIEKRKSIHGKSRVVRPVFSFDSPVQLKELLYNEEMLGLPVIDKTKKGHPSTGYDTIQKLTESNPEVQPLLNYQELKGVYSTFVVGMLDRIESGRIYPHFNVSGTKTGRISHTDPNMGNLPKEGVIRNFFLPSPGHVIIGADYAQLEVVIELNLTDDPGLKEIVLGGASKHDLFKVELDKAGFNLPRSQVKNVNFALQYGAGARKVSKMVGCSIKDGERIIEVFYNKFNGVKRLKDETCATLARDGQVTNLAGRIRHFEKPTSEYEKARQERQAYNFLIQGLASEVCNRAYYRFTTQLKTLGDGRGLFSVHDEIVAEVSTWPSSFMRKLTDIMQDAGQDFSFKYPLKATPYGPLSFWTKT